MSDSNSSSKPKRRKNGAGTIWFDVKANRWRARWIEHTRRSPKQKTISRQTEEAVAAALEQAINGWSLEDLEKDSKEGSTVYFIQGVLGGPIKIGVTSNLRERFRLIQSCSPAILMILHTIEGADASVEAKIHKRFRLHRLHGEWFENVADLMRYIDGLRKQEKRRKKLRAMSDPS